tara:strand:+ start:300 stop:581 length:282 start_codon:yes stop_codon:yes gene_type:complete
MDFYMYKSICSGWLGDYSDIKHIVVLRDTDEEEVLKKAKLITENSGGGTKCDIQLLQKYHMMIEPKKSYPALTGFTFHGSSIPTAATNSEVKS